MRGGTGAEGGGAGGPSGGGPGSVGPATGRPVESKGELRPGRTVRIRRLEVPASVSALARHVWIPRWDLPEGEVAEQPILEYPGTNVVVEPGAAALYGPRRGLSTRVLRGRSWAVGVLLRPAAGTVMTGRSMADIVGTAVPVPRAPDLVPGLRAVMGGTRGAGADRASSDGAADRDAAALGLVIAWLREFRVDEEGVLINAIVDAVESDAGLTRVADLSARVGLDERRLQRICRRRIGYPPKWLIARRRLQDAAHLLRTDSGTALADIAQDLGYSDQAHFARDFAAVIGQPPGVYRSQAGG